MSRNRWQSRGIRAGSRRGQAAHRDTREPTENPPKPDPALPAPNDEQNHRHRQHHIDRYHAVHDLLRADPRGRQHAILVSQDESAAVELDFRLCDLLRRDNVIGRAGHRRNGVCLFRWAMDPYVTLSMRPMPYWCTSTMPYAINPKRWLTDRARSISYRVSA